MATKTKNEHRKPERLQELPRDRQTRRLLDNADEKAVVYTAGVFAPATRIGYPIGYPVEVEWGGKGRLIGATEEYAVVEFDAGDLAGRVRAVEWGAVGPVRCGYDVGEEAWASTDTEELQWLIKSLYAIDVAAHEAPRKMTEAARAPMEARVRELCGGMWPTLAE